MTVSTSELSQITANLLKKKLSQLDGMPSDDKRMSLLHNVQLFSGKTPLSRLLEGRPVSNSGPLVIELCVVTVTPVEEDAASHP